MLVGIVLAGCGDATEPTRTSFEGFDGCRAGADSVVVFLQRTLDGIGTAEPAALGEFTAEFDEGVHALLLRAQEVHCTEDGFNDAVIVRVDELEGHGPGGILLIESVRLRGLGSLDDGRGGPVRLPMP